VYSFGIAARFTLLGGAGLPLPALFHLRRQGY
jgi:hypothetical protein